VEPDDGNIFVTNFGSDSVSEISSYTNEVGNTFTIGSGPSQDMISRDGSTLWVTNFGGDSVALYSIDDAKLIASVHTGSGPDALAFCADPDEHLVLVTDARSGDVAVIRNQNTPSLLTLLPAGNQPNAIAVKKLGPS
jgi:YVTN family beta-propeller protein